MREYGTNLVASCSGTQRGSDAHSAFVVRVAAKEMKVNSTSSNVSLSSRPSNAESTWRVMVGALARDMGGARTTSCKSAKDDVYRDPGAREMRTVGGF